MDMNDNTNPLVAQAKAKSQPLPKSLEDALLALETNEELKATIGGVLIDSYIKLRRQQCVEHQSQVSAWELKTYLDV